MAYFGFCAVVWSIHIMLLNETPGQVTFCLRVSEIVLTVLADLLDVGAACLYKATEVPRLGPAAVCSHTGHPVCGPPACHRAKKTLLTQPKHG